MQLITPNMEALPSYVQALQRGWSPNTLRPEAAQEELAYIARDAQAFVASLDDRQGKGAPITLPDGSLANRLPGFRRWLWHDGFCGSIGLRWQPGGEALPAYCSGHIGYTVVPWHQGRGYATQALRLLLPEAWAVGLRYVELTTDHGNRASQRVIESNGGQLVDTVTHIGSRDGNSVLRYRIYQ